MKRLIREFKERRKDRRSGKGKSKRFIEEKRRGEIDAFVKVADPRAHQTFVKEMNKRGLFEMQISPDLMIVKGPKKYLLVGEKGVIRSFGEDGKEKY